MGSKKKKTILFRRKRKNKTNHRIRLKLVLSGKPRLVVRKSLKNIYAQVVEYLPNGDKVLVCATGRELEKLGWKGNARNMPAAYLCGLLIGKKALEKNIKECVADLGMQAIIRKSKLFAVLKGAKDAGLNLKVSEKAIPDESRIKGEHIVAWAQKAKQNKELYEKMFSSYLKRGFPPENIVQNFEEVKKKILGK